MKLLLICRYTHL